MLKPKDLTTDVATHFAFGENWSDYSRTIDETRIQSAVENLQRLLNQQTLGGLSFLDIGCGSGIHSLSALRLGAGPLLAVDFDPVSVNTCRDVLSKWADGFKWTCQPCSVFDIDSATSDKFDIVYSWGVLHHTGDMWKAIGKAAEKVKPGGLFALAVYVKTRLCEFWKIEKRIYRRFPTFLQFPFICLYSAVDLTRLLVRGVNPIKWVREYRKLRGMNYWHDAHDWLGGYPYESASAEEVAAFMKRQGFTLLKSFNTESSLGLTGSGCAEYLFIRNQTT
jgi:SAM-dependent methyltransferase